MKRFVYGLFFLPFLTSCEVVQPEYYDSGYYHSVPPRAEVYGFDERPHDYRHSQHRHPRAQKHVTGYPHQDTMHRYRHNKKQVVVIHSRRKNMHGHGNQPERVARHRSESGAEVRVPDQVHGHS